MKPFYVIENKSFIGRESEQAQLFKIAKNNRSSIIITYGRRRIGKTELLEQTFRDRNLIKFEGIEGQNQSYQMQVVMQQLADYAEQPLLKQITIINWIDVFKQIYTYTKTGKWTIYFEEVQWLSGYQSQFVNELKYVWDNFWSKNPEIIIILCGSAPSFMINEIAHSKALYNRSQYELPVNELNLIEAQELLNKNSLREVMDAYLTIGGIPAYLLYLKQESSIFLSLSQNAFIPMSFFSNEYQRIFISSLAENPNYQKIIEFLSKQRFATRNKILAHLKEKSGGRLTELLNDLELCGFITKYSPYYLSDESTLSRYCIQDSYLQFYFKFIKPIAKNIKDGVFKNNPTATIKMDTYYKWLGFSFERFCRRYHYVIANILRFGAVHYRSGAYFNRKMIQQDQNFQIDLVFDRDDHVITICEIKYLLSPVSSQVISEFERKLKSFPNPQNKEIHKVLIAGFGANTKVKESYYFDQIITLDDLFNRVYWK
jgi:AAA+ ATPase superfamily predicted ATPase